jgi:carboxyl-terminal processing protease
MTMSLLPRAIYRSIPLTLLTLLFCLAARSSSAQQTLPAQNGGDAISVEERVAGFVRLWSEVKYNFAFFDRVPELNWDKVLDEYLPQVLKEQTTEEYYRLLERCVARLKDGHTTVYPPHKGQVGQLPVRLKTVAGKLIVAEVAEAAAAAEPRLKPGLEITHVDGRPVAKILKQDIYPYVADSTPQNRDRWAVRRLIEGPVDSQAEVRTQDADGKALEFNLTRANWRYPRTSSFRFQDVGEDMAYVALDSFESDEAASWFKGKMQEILRHKGLVIDVRSNGGGSSNVGYAVLSRLIDKPAYGSRWKTRQYMPAFRAWGQKETWHEGGPSVVKPAAEKPFLGPVVVLIGADTVSAAEDFVVAIHAAGRATLVGEKTAGTTGMPLMIKLPRGGRARICTKWDFYPDGREFVGVGVIPDVEVYPSRESLAAGSDVVLEKGLQVLAKRIGKDSLDVGSLAAGLTARLAAQRVTPASRSVAAIIKDAQAVHEALTAAYARKDWRAIEERAHDLSKLLRREGLIFMDLKVLRERLKAAGRLDQQAEADLARAERRKREIAAFFKVEPGSEDIHRLLGQVERLSDKVHDRIRDGRNGDVPAVYSRFEERWKELQERIDKAGAN